MTPHPALVFLHDLEKTFHALMTNPSRPEIFGVPAVQIEAIRTALTRQTELEKAAEGLAGALCVLFPFDGCEPDFIQKTMELMEAQGLVEMTETEKDSFDEQEYGQHVWRLTEKGEALSVWREENK